MEQNQPLLSRVRSLSEAEKLELFNVEELESRLEMAAVDADATNGACGNTVKVTVNEVCW